MARISKQAQAAVNQFLAVLYLRVSTQEQATEGISLETQEAKLRAYCALRGLTIVKVIIEAGVSAGKPLDEREGGHELLTLVRRREVAHVVSYKLDRLFRDCADCLTVTAAWDKHGVSLHLVDLGGQTLDTSTAMGRFFLTVMRIPVIPATQSSAKLPSNPGEACHRIQTKAATPSERSDAWVYRVTLRSRRFSPSRAVYAANLL